MTKKEKERIQEILNRLDAYYSTEYRCYLKHDNAWQLLIATILSAQCTDARVNTVTGPLFAAYPDAAALGAARLEDVEQLIHATGLYHSKAKNIIACSAQIAALYGGEVPQSLEALTSLPGVGRKTANVIRGNIFHEPSIVVDTHVKRIAYKLGLTTETEPEKVEQELMRVLPRDHWILINIQLITHGRGLCPARSPKCGQCFLQDLCPGKD